MSTGTGDNLYVSIDDINPDPFVSLTTIYQELLYVTYVPGDILVAISTERTSCGECVQVPSFRSQRELFYGFKYKTVRVMLAANLRDYTDYTVYRRDFLTNTVVEVTFDTVLKPRDSIVAILPEVVNIDRYLEFLNSHKELIPTREV